MSHVMNCYLFERKQKMAKRLFFVCFVVGLVFLAMSGCNNQSGIKVAQETKSRDFVLRVNCGAYESYTDNAGNVWLPDQYFEEGQAWGVIDGMTIDRGDLGITGTDCPRIYETERYSLSAYKFIVPNGKYTVRLHFAETFEGITGEGQRVFSVSINDQIVLDDLDLYKEVGDWQKPIVKEFKNVAVTNKELVIGFTFNIENPEINGIEILSE
jgi:endoglucanase